MRKLMMGLAVTAALAIAAPAEAAVDYTVSGAGSGTFSLELTGSTYTLTAVDLTFGSASFDLSNSLFETFGAFWTLGGQSFGVNGLASGTDDFNFIFNPALPSQDVFPQYTNIGNPSEILGGRATVNQVAAAVPEPGTWAMMLLGFGAAGAALRRSRRRSVHSGAARWAA